jgi:hypothetical protein
MNLQETVSEILKRPVSIDEAKQFALDQYGVLVAFIKKQKKETRVFVLNGDNVSEDIKFSGHDIQNWVSYQEHHDKLTSDAQEFIKLCEQDGNVYSLYSFHEAFNVEELIGANDFFFITNNY